MKLVPMTAIAALCGFIVPLAAQAQNAPATNSAKSASTTNVEELDEVVVSTRIVRDGYKAPTPTSVLGTAEIQANAPSNIANFVNQLPSLAGSNTPSVTTGAVSSGLAGINSLNLRALSTNAFNRTLVLVDGRRVPPSAATGLVDINTIPQELITRVDVVTGGASAAWGSDALAGVVNFTLDKKFTGLKANVQGTSTSHGDNRGYNIALTGGTGFANGRGHVILSGELAHSDGIEGLPRSWYKGYKTLLNPAYVVTNGVGNGQPQLIVRENSGYRVATPGLIINTGPLRGTYFGPGGTPAQLNTGSLAGTTGFVGGDWAYADFGRTGDLEARIARQSAYGRVSFDVTDNVELFAEASYGNSDVFSRAIDQFNLGNLTIRPDNAFLPANLAAILVADGAPTYGAGSLNADLPPLTATNTRSLQRYMVGANGTFNAGGSGWSWNAYLQTSRANLLNQALASITARYRSAIDSVRNASGQIVCRVNADAITTNDDPACVPYNIFGTGTASQPAINYVTGTSFLRTELVQDVVAVTVRGEPFSSWAGPISVAAGLEHRREKVDSNVDALDQVSSPYFAGNYKPTIGSYNVSEGFLETVIPLAVDQAWAKKLDLNAAVRATKYSTSGNVTTWKAGLTFTPIEDLTFRATRSRDIRAPALSELFATGIAGTSTLLDPFRNNVSTTYITVTSGNLNLKPEKADTTGVGVIFQPRFVPGLTASVDYYNIDIAGAVSTFDGPTIVNGCFIGIATLCSGIVRDATGSIVRVNTAPFNANSQKARGIDIEASYRRPLDTLVSSWTGNVTLRMFATHYLKNFTHFANPASVDTETAGTNTTLGPPNWRFLASLGYDNGPATFTLTGRGLSKGVYSNEYIQCSTSCPTSTVARTTIDNNHIAGSVYLDTSLSYQVTDTTTVFLTVANVLDKDPAPVPATQNIGNAPQGINRVLYDAVGRTFRFGVRFRLN